MYYIYMIRCEDNSLYTGITTDIARRMEEHRTKSEKCAKYTRLRSVKQLESLWTAKTKQAAYRLEYYIKTLKKEQKERLVADKSLLKTFLGEKINCNDYTVAEYRNM